MFSALCTYVDGELTENHTLRQVQNTYLDGSWNKGKGGNGYFRLSKAWNSLIQNNTMRNLRHLAVQWSASNNIIQNNNINADLNLHGGWERYNLFQNNTVRVPYEHRDCNPNCSPGSETWYPIWWAAGDHAGGWSGASGPQNVFYNNALEKQLSSGGAYTPYTLYSTPGTVYMLGWDRDTAGGSYWVHLSTNGAYIPTWTGRENIDFSADPNSGVNDLCTSITYSLVGASLTCNGQVQPTSTPPPPTATPTATVTPGGPTVTPTPTEEVSAGDCTVTASYGSEWNSGYNAEIFITNDGPTTISGWALTFEFNHGETITDFWRVDSWSQSGALASATLDSGGTRGDIAPGETVDIKYQVSHNGTYDLPSNYILNGLACNGQGTQPTTTPVPPTVTLVPPTFTPVPPTATSVVPTETPVEDPTPTPVPPTATTVPSNTPVPPTATTVPSNTPVPPTATTVPSNTPVPPTATTVPSNTPLPPPTATPTNPPASASCTVTFVYDSEWNSGYNAEVFITNNGTMAINGWTLTFTFNNGETFTDFWRVQNSSQSGAIVTASAGSGHYNGTINPGETTDVKYQVSHNGTYGLPTGVTLNGQPCN